MDKTLFMDKKRRIEYKIKLRYSGTRMNIRHVYIVNKEINLNLLKEICRI